MCATRRRGRPGRPRHPIPRERLLEVACAVFAEHGYTGASMGDIAGRAGLSKSSLFHHFASKESLYLEVMTTSLEHVGRFVRDAQVDESDYLTRLDRLSDVVVDYLAVQPGLARLLVRELVDGGPYFQGPGNARVKTTISAIAAFLELGIHQGVVKPQDTAQLTLSLVGLHLHYFATPAVAAIFFADPLDGADAVAARKEAARAQLHRLIGATPAD